MLFRFFILLILLVIAISCNKKMQQGDQIPTVKVMSRKPIHQWPSSDHRMDAVHANRIMYNYDLYKNAIYKNTPLLIISPLNNLESIEKQKNGTVNLNNRSKQFSTEKNKPVPITKQHQQFIKEFNGSLNNGDKEEFYQNFINYIQVENETIRIGSYISSSTCVLNPISDKNISGVENTYPQSVINCKAIGLATGQTATFYPGMRGQKDSRWYIDFNDPEIREKAISQIVKDIPENTSDFIFLDNVRYFSADWQETVVAEKKYFDCIDLCDNLTCLEECRKNINYYDSRKDSDVAGVSITEDQNWVVNLNNYYLYYQELLVALNNIKIKGILNISVLPYVLGNQIEKGFFQDLKSILNGNGVAFEQAWKAKHSPRYVLNEINVYRELLSEGTLILLYPKYNNEQEGFWFAAMTYILREEGYPIFNMRSPYYSTPAWCEWPSTYGAAIQDFEFKTNCPDCMNKRGGFAGNFVVLRSFEKAYIAAGSITLSQEKTQANDIQELLKLIEINTTRNKIILQNEPLSFKLNKDLELSKINSSNRIENKNGKYYEDYIHLYVENYKEEKPLHAFISILQPIN